MNWFKTLMLHAICGFCLCCGAADTNAPLSGSDLRALSEKVNQAMERIQIAVDRVEAMEKQIEGLTNGINAILGQLHAGSKTAIVAGASVPFVPANNSNSQMLARIRFTAEDKLVNFAELDNHARTWLKREKVNPPEDIMPVFEVADEEAFVTVKYLQGVGERFWFITFNRNYDVVYFGTRLLTAQD